MPHLCGGIGAHQRQQKDARAARRKSRTSPSVSVVPDSTTTSATATDATTSDSSDNEDSDAEESTDAVKKDDTASEKSESGEAMTGSKWVDIKEPAVSTATAGIIETVGRLIA